VRILALSDIGRWNGCERLVQRCKPDVVVLAGDLTSDGSANFWREALEFLPKFHKERRLLRKKTRDAEQFGGNCVICEEAVSGVGPYCKYDATRDSRRFFQQKNKRHWPYPDHLLQLETYHRKTKAFDVARTEIHIDRFYAFLRYAGKRSIVLVIKGDHDDDFPGDYDSERIDNVPGCREISGKVFSVGGATFLGLGFQQAGFLRPLRALVNEYRGEVDVVVAHVPQKNLRTVAELRPRLLIRGHYGSGQHLLDGVPCVFTASEYVLSKMPKNGTPSFQIVGYHSRMSRLLAPSRVAGMRDTYPWLHPFPDEPGL
jgi:hypothetical protein